MKNNLFKNWFLLFLGLIITLLPWMGFPQEIKTAITITAGLLVILCAFVLARPARVRTSLSFSADSSDADSFTENDQEKEI